MRRPQLVTAVGAIACLACTSLPSSSKAADPVPAEQSPSGQPSDPPFGGPFGGPPGAPPFGGPPPFFGGGPGGRGFPGPMMGQEIQLVERFDKNGDKRLNAEERQVARESLKNENARGPGRRGRGGPRFGGFGGENTERKPGRKLSPQDVPVVADKPLYDPFTLRTLFLDFENADWESELEDFHGTDVEVPARLTVDGKEYPGVGVHFRGMSSYGMIPTGAKRSLNVAIDFEHEDQRLLGYRTLNLLNSHEDPTYLRSVLFYQVAREYLPAPKANLVRVVINGESWGVYANVQQFNKDFVAEWYNGTTKGARWKVPGSPRGQGSLAYLGSDVASYQSIYEIKSKDSKKSWEALVHLCQVLNETPIDQLQSALEPVLAVDEALKFLALENALINNDGYWIRTSDYSLYLDEKGRFHVLPQDANETFFLPGGPGFGGGPPGFRGGRRFGGGPRLGGAPGTEGGPGFGPGPGPGGGPGFGERPDFGGGPGNPSNGGGRPPGFGAMAGGSTGVELDPLIAAKDEGKPLISRLLAIPALRERYLGYVRDIAERWLDWERLGPIAERYHALIADEVRQDTRGLDSFENFQKGLLETTRGGGGLGGRGTIGLKEFADQRRAYLLKYTSSPKG